MIYTCSCLALSGAKATTGPCRQQHSFPLTLQDYSITQLSAAGASYQQHNDLPQGTILLDGQDIMVRDSTFSNMVFFGQGSVILLNSIVDFENVRLEQRHCLLSCSLHGS